jgi:hypothetical protein
MFPPPPFKSRNNFFLKSEKKMPPMQATCGIKRFKVSNFIMIEDFRVFKIN